MDRSSLSQSQCTLNAWHSPLEALDLTKPRYDQRTYVGRFRHFVSVTSPKHLLATRSQLERAEKLVNVVKKRESGWESVPAEDAWAAQTLLWSAVGANGTIVLPLRLAAFMPMNLFVLFFMLHPSQQTPARGMLWQWVNQTYNSGVNYANRGEKGDGGLSSLLGSYALAVSMSCSVSFLGSKLTASLGASAPSWTRLVVPYIAVASANIANVAMIRRQDYQTGVTVADLETGEVLGKSVTAGRIAVTQVAISRILVPLPLMLLPGPITSVLLTKVPFFRARRAQLETPLTLGVIAVMLSLVLPACIAVYPQETTLPVSALEAQFQNRRTTTGQPVTHVAFNKGL